MRTILTDSCELICLKCYEEVKESVSKVKSIDIVNWLKEEVNIEEVKLNFSTSLSEFSLKLK
jgi:copper chaperone CopZ